MKTIARIFAISLMATLLSSAAHATGYFSNVDPILRLQLDYDSNDVELRAAYLSGYVAGVARSTQGNTWCPVEQLGSEELRRVVSSYLERNPSIASETPDAAITTALKASFPCAGK
ncbi:MAG: Rap1a/Tai family immunity protein [Rhodocyclaceae bacterium]|nr:Rap1a/Tai family immunity protein [Rhodocyclaceae bacterium]